MNFNVRTKIRVNGHEYANVDEMPPAARELYQSALVNAKAGQSSKIVFNGQEYSSPYEMPPDVRDLYQAAMNSMNRTGNTSLQTIENAAAPTNRFAIRISGGRLFIGRWFQLSLLTAGLMLLVLAVEVHLNTRLSLDDAKSHYERGWPCVMYGYGGEAGIRLTNSELEALRRARGSGLRRRSNYAGVPTVFFWKDPADIAWVPGQSGPEPEARQPAAASVFWDGEWYVRDMLLNLAVASILLIFTAVFCEALLRWRTSGAVQRQWHA